MKLSDINYIQVIVRINEKYHLVLLNEETRKILPEIIVGMEGTLRLLETELPLKEINMDEIKKISENKQYS